MSGANEVWIARDPNGWVFLHSSEPHYERPDDEWDLDYVGVLDKSAFSQLLPRQKARLILDPSSIVSHDGTPVAPVANPVTTDTDEALLDKFAGLALEAYILARAMLAEKRRLKQEAT